MICCRLAVLLKEISEKEVLQDVIFISFKESDAYMFIGEDDKFFSVDELPDFIIHKLCDGFIQSICKVESELPSDLKDLAMMTQMLLELSTSREKLERTFINLHRLVKHITLSGIKLDMISKHP